MIKYLILFALIGLVGCGESKTDIAIERYDEFIADLPAKVRELPGYNPEALDEQREEFVELAQSNPDSAIAHVVKLEIGLEMMREIGAKFAK